MLTKKKPESAISQLLKHLRHWRARHQNQAPCQAHGIRSVHSSDSQSVEFGQDEI